MRRGWHHSHAAQNPRHRRAKFGRPALGKQDFRYVAEEDIYICPARWRSSPTTLRTRKMDWSCTTTGPTACRTLRAEGSVHEGTANVASSGGRTSMLLIAVQARLGQKSGCDAYLAARRSSHPFGTLKMADGGRRTFLMKTAAEGGDRDGAACARLQTSRGVMEHRRYQTVPRGDPGLRSGS